MLSNRVLYMRLYLGRICKTIERKEPNIVIPKPSHLHITRPALNTIEAENNRDNVTHLFGLPIVIAPGLAESGVLLIIYDHETNSGLALLSDGRHALVTIVNGKVKVIQYE